jgi:hypothetical protein
MAHEPAQPEIGEGRVIQVRCPRRPLETGWLGQPVPRPAADPQVVPAGNANPVPNQNRSSGNVLLGAAHAGTTPGETWAVGYYYNGSGTGSDYGVRRTLVERYNC